MRHTIRFRLTAWYVAALALCFVVLGSVGLLLSERTLLHWLDESLQVKAQRLAGLEVVDTVEDGYSVTTPEGRLVEQVGLPRQLDFTRTEAFQAGRKGASSGTTVEGSGRRWRVVSWPRGSGGGVEAVVLAGHDLHEIDSMLALMRWGTLGLMPLVLLLVAAGGWLLVGRILSRVDALAVSIAAISESDLGQRHPDQGRDELGRLTRVVNALLDRLQQAFERQRRFTADASHELRTPLATIRALTSQKLMEERTPEDYRDALQRIAKTADYMGVLVRQLLLLARADGGHLLPDREVFDLSVLLSDIADQIREAHAREVRCQLSGGLEVEADPTQMTQLFLNLLDNAARHTAPDGVIQIESSRQGQRICVSVSDNGEGIPAEHLPHLFERFYRVDPARSRDTGGAGLGLPIARCIAELHGGSLEVESRLGLGTTVRVYLEGRP